MTGPGVDVVIRPFERRDRPTIRRICFETGYMGEPEWQWRDAESYADLFTGYYTDEEPESAFVVERSGVVEGYLLGCVDSRRAWREESIFLRLLWTRWIAVRPSTAAFVWRSFGDVLVAGLRRQDFPRRPDVERWPAHLHIDLLPSVRGRGAGTRLLGAWIGRLEELGVPGCHLQTLAENQAAIRAFESVGFERHGGAALAPGLRTRTGGRHHVQALVRTIGG